MMYITLFVEYFKVGFFAVGGGLATLPFIQKLIDKYGWITNQELIDMIAISESTPGPIGINLSTYMGVKAAGRFGGIIATLGIISPSIIIIVMIAKLFSKFSEEPLVQAGFSGIRPVVAGLICAVCFDVFKIALLNPLAGDVWEMFNVPALALCAVLVFLIFKFNKHPIFYLLGAAIAGIFI